MIILRYILAIVLGVILGGFINMSLVTVGPSVFPPPEGVDMADTESLSSSAHLLKPQHFVFPFLAHALGTLVGSLVAYLLAVSRKTIFAYIVGFVYLAGGITASVMIPAPKWFVALDLIVAYIPMAWLSTKIGPGLARRFFRQG